MVAPAPLSADRGPLARVAYASIGFLSTGLGVIGFIVPGLPSTVFFVFAGWCFARASPRLERWFLGLPVIGTLVRDYRDGLGMPRPAKVTSVIVMWTAIGVSGWLLHDKPWLVALIAVLGVIGTTVVVWRVPTKERVLEARAVSR